MKRKLRKMMAAALVIAALGAMTGCGSDGGSGNSGLSGRSHMARIMVTSESVKDGKLKTECCYTKATPPGKNQSPQVSFEQVKDGAVYAIYLYDRDAKNYLHWRVADMTDLQIPEGTMTQENMYIGPFPPKGTTHHYEIVVYAMKQSPGIYEGELNHYTDVDKVEKSLDTVNGTSGNVVGMGTLKFTVSADK